MMNDWYSEVSKSEGLTQGELIFNCPVLTWSQTTGGEFSPEILSQSVSGIATDLVVMTQACDLEHEKVSSVVLCPHVSLKHYRSSWETALKSHGHQPSEKAWRKVCSEIANGTVWNLSLLNALDGQTPSETRIVDFHDVYTLPRTFLEAFIRQSQSIRIRLNPPYREHLSQSFARYFMRVGLPTPVLKSW
jgi:hypothetical protein